MVGHGAARLTHPTALAEPEGPQRVSGRPGPKLGKGDCKRPACKDNVFCLLETIRGEGRLTMQKKLAASSLCAAALAMGIIATVGGVIRAEEAQDRYLGVTDPVQDKAPFIRYGVTLVHLQDDFWKGMAYGMVDETKHVGGKVVQVSIAGKYGNMAEQYAQIEAMMTKGIDVLVLGPSAYDGFDPMLKKVKEKGITVIAAGIPLGSKLADFGVVMSDYDIGKRMGNALCQHRPKDKQTFKTLALPGPAGAEWTKLRVDGLLESAKSCPGEEVIVAPVGGEISIG